MAVRQLSVFLENRTGTLCEVTQALSDNGIDVRAITLADTVEFGILRLIVSDPVKAEEVLRAHHFTVSITEVLCVRVDDVPGGLNAVVDTTLNLPKIRGGTTLIYTQIDLPLTAIADFAEKGKTEPMFAKLAEICERHNGLWSAEAEKYLLANAKSI